MDGKRLNSFFNPSTNTHTHTHTHNRQGMAAASRRGVAGLMSLALVASARAFLLPPASSPPPPPRLAAAAATSRNGPPSTLLLQQAAELTPLLQEGLRLMSPDPATALAEGKWVKLICGASYQDLCRVQALALVYTLAGVDCIDMSASDAVVTAAEEGVEAAMALAQGLLGQPLPRRPWLMVSVNDQEDLHFRKASFDPARCPSDCPRPCETICPTQAIPSLAVLQQQQQQQPGGEGVAFQDRCYGCGRCLSVCPLGLIEARPYQVEAAQVLTSLAGRVDALEIHTNASTSDRAQSAANDPFEDLCRRIQMPAARLKAISVSFPFLGDAETTAFLHSRSGLFDKYFGTPDQNGASALVHIWQTDGRPMSGDIGKGTTLSAVKFGEVVLRSHALPWARPGSAHQQHFLQLAGGTNAYTAEKLAALGLLSQEEDEKPEEYVHGLAFGGFARMEVDRVMGEWGVGPETSLLQAPPGVLAAVLRAALDVIRPMKERGRRRGGENVGANAKK